MNLRSDNHSLTGPRSGIFLAVLAGVSLLRLHECLLPPARSGDLYRHLYTGIMVREEGWKAAALPLTSWSPDLAQLAPWSDHAYNYPPLALGFFVALSLVSPSVLAAKLLLTLCEAANAWLVFTLVRSRWVALAYWALPLSVCWVSREGQFEPLQNLLLLFGLRLMQQGRPAGFGAGVAACLVKLSAALLVPYWLGRWLQLDGRRRLGALGWILGALIPLGAACLAWPVISQVLSTATWPVTFNPWHWRSPFDPRYGGWFSVPVLLLMRAATLVFAAACVWLAIRRRLGWSVLASIGLFLLSSSLMGVFQGWYFCALTPFLLLASDTRARILLLVLLQCCEPQSVYSLLGRSSGRAGPYDHVPVTQSLEKPAP